MRAIAHLRDEIQRVVVASQIVRESSRLSEEHVESLAPAVLKDIPLVEVIRRQFPQTPGAFGPRSKDHLAFGPVAEIDLGIRRPEPLGEGPSRASPQAELAKQPFDVFAGPQRVDREIRARAVVVAQALAANRHAVFTSGHRVRHEELRKDRLRPQVYDAVVLPLRELPSQRDLPLFERHLLGLAHAGDLRRRRFAGPLPPARSMCRFTDHGQYTRPSHASSSKARRHTVP